MRGLMPWKRDNNQVQNRESKDWFDSFFENPFSILERPFDENLGNFQPLVDVNEDDKKVTVKSEIPGMSKDDLDISFNNGMLRISGEKKEEKTDKDKGWYRRECSYGSFCRNVPVGDNVDWEKAKAKYKDGVLNIEMPKKDEKKDDKVKITVE